MAWACREGGDCHACQTAGQPARTHLGGHARHLPDGSLGEGELHALGRQQRCVLLEHVVLWLRENAVEVVRPAEPCACGQVGQLWLAMLCHAAQ